MIEVREAQKTSENAGIVLDLMFKHPKTWDCGWAAYSGLRKQSFLAPNTRTWIAWDGDAPVGFMMSMRLNIPNNEIIVLCTYVEPGGIFKQVIADLSRKVMSWATRENVNRIRWSTTTSAEAWKRHLGNVATNDFTLDGISESVSLVWERRKANV